MITPILVVLIGLASQVSAQIGKTTATCTYADWTSFKGNSPCQIWANLQAACDPNASVGILDTASNSHVKYPTPSGSSATPCQCNVVAYNMMAACSWCQPNVYSDNWVTEAEWKSGCTDYNPSGLPSQASSLSSQIPAYAFSVENGDAWLAFEASSIAGGGTAPTAVLSTSNRPFGATGTGFTTGRFTTGFTTGTRFPAATITGPFNGGDDFDPLETVNLGKVIGIPVGIILGLYVLLGGVVLAVFFTRQKNRKAWYGPTAKFYRDGGRMVQEGSQSLLTPNAYAQQQSSNPFTTPSPTASPATTAPYDPNLPYGQGGQGYNQQYYDPAGAQSNTYPNVHQQHVIQV